MSQFKKILIANRGEIARRVIKTCQRLGISTVAVYSEADQAAPFVKEADEAVCIGPAPVKQSYLNKEKIIEAAKTTGAEAIHPGYGFMAENASFAEQCQQEGLTFIGPQPEIIRLMGDKITARQAMAKAGVPTVPGVDHALDSVEEALTLAEQIGYLIMLKASAGGGGIGMQVVQDAEELRKAFHATAQKAVNFFGNGALFLEKYITSPRHIEVQIAADQHGQVIHMWERECSIQRRNQKVIEEAPSPFLNQTQREALCQTAIKGAASIGYSNVGTMEFIFDTDGQFYFLEMNTRIQVEHPVTECITNLDLVEWQIRIAQGERLPLEQAEIPLQGHALECRLYAEDPYTYMPSPGTIEKLQLPSGARLDFAVEEGDKVTPFYDPMIGKVIVSAATRKQAIDQMHQALKATQVQGITCNLPLLLEILENKSFQIGEFTTKFLEKTK